MHFKTHNTTHPGKCEGELVKADVLQGVQGPQGATGSAGLVGLPGSKGEKVRAEISRNRRIYTGSENALENPID